MSSKPRFEPGLIHFTILGLSAFLVGIYSTGILAVGVSQIVLKSGILGAIASLSIGGFAMSRAEHKQTARAKVRVEGRLDRHVDGGVTRIDADSKTIPPAPNTIAEPARRTVHDAVS